MYPTISDNTKNPILINSGETVNPFGNIAISDPLVFNPDNSPQPDEGIIKIVLNAASGTTGSLGLLSQQVFYTIANVDLANNSITEATATGFLSPLDPNTILEYTQYTAPVVQPGQTLFVNASLTYTHAGGDTVTDPTPVVLEVVGPSAPTLTGPTPGTTILTQTQTFTPFASVIVTEPTSATTIPEVVTVRLGTVGPQDPYPFAVNSQFKGGTISDPLGGGSFDAATSVFTETARGIPGQADDAQTIINRLVYTPPALMPGAGEEIQIDVSVNNSDGSADTSPISVPHGQIAYVQNVTNPSITAGPAQSVVSGTSINPFSGAAITDNIGLFPFNSAVSLQVLISDDGIATDDDGILSGSGLTKTGVGTYSLSTNNVYAVQDELQHGLVFTTATLPANQSRTDVFTLTAMDSATRLSTANSDISVTTYGPDVASATPVTIGTGPDALVLQVNEDAYQGNAQFTVSVDGVQQGGVQTATALRSDGQTQAFTIDGSFGYTDHIISVDFLNDNGAYGSTDRNLYVTGATIDGVAVQNSALTEYVSGPQSIVFVALQPPTLSGSTSGTTILIPGQTFKPFPNLIVTEPASSTPIVETVTLRLGTVGPQNPYPFASGRDVLGTILDPTKQGTFNAGTNTFTETTTTFPGQADAAQAIINRLVYTPPILADGAGVETVIDVSVNNSDGGDGTSPVFVPHGTFADVVDATNPLITGTQQTTIASGSGPVDPFSSVALFDDGFLFFVGNNVYAQITITADGTATDADGTLTGIPKTGVGTYGFTAGNVYGIQSELRNVAFWPAGAVASNAVRSDVLTLSLTDPATGLSTTDSGTSVNVVGPTVYVPGAPVSVGSGPDALVLQVSEDAFGGNAQFTISIDGVQQGGVQSATAGHELGETQAFTVKGDFGASAHTVSVDFLNDNGNQGLTDRNLYVTGATIDGVAVPGATLNEYANGPGTFQFTGSTATSTPPTTLDTLTVGLTEDAYQGDAMASISLDGKTLAMPTVTFLNSGGTAEQFTYSGNFGGAAALHSLSVDFLNDNGGYGTSDRNLYVKDLSFDGTALPTTATLYSGGTIQTTFQNNTVVSPFPTQH